MKHFFLVSFLITIVFFSSCRPANDCHENGSMHGYTIISIDSVDYIVVYNSYGSSGICPKVVK